MPDAPPDVPEIANGLAVRFDEHVTTPVGITVAGLTFARINRDEGMTVWRSVLESRIEISIIDDNDEPSEPARETVTSIVADVEQLIERAASFVREELRSTANLDESDRELLLSDRQGSVVDAVAEPEILVWSDGTWTVRFAQSSLAFAAEEAIAVTFVGDQPQWLEDLTADL